MPLILPGNVASALPTGYEVANSCRFNRADSAYMHKTPGSAGNQIQFTISLWCKRGTLGTKQTLFSTIKEKIRVQKKKKKNNLILEKIIKKFS